MSRREYIVDLVINGRKLQKIIIDPHYEEKHADSVNDEVIIKLVNQLDKKTFKPIDKDEDGFSYYMNDRMELDGKLYKLIWLLHDDEIYIGIVNTYRRK